MTEKETFGHESDKKLTPEQEQVLRALENYDEGQEKPSFELKVEEIRSKLFLQKLASIRLDHEVSVVESDGGMALITLSVVDSKGFAVAGDGSIQDRHERGAFSIHTHLEDTPYDLAPSPGDMHVNRKRSFNVSTPAMIMNEYGYSIVGINPHARYFAEEVREFHQPGKNESINFIVEQGGWLSNLPSNYESFFERVHHSDISDDVKLKYALKLAKELGMVIEHRAWEDVDKVPDIVFDSQAASVFWKDHADSQLEKIKNGEISLEDFAKFGFNKVDSIFEEMFDEVRKS